MYSQRSRETFDARWLAMYALAQRYCREQGDLLVPCEYVTPCGKRLGRWVGTQRDDAKKGRAALSPQRRALLDELGMVWDVKEADRERMFCALQAYYEQHGDLCFPKDLTSADGRSLGAWLTNLRVARLKGTLSAPVIARLDAMGMVWSCREELDERWSERYQECVEFVRAQGHAHIPKSYRAAGGALTGCWLCEQRRLGRAGLLSPQRLQKLEQLTPVQPLREARWQAFYAAAKDYFTAHQNLLPPPGVRCAAGNLSAWVASQRVRYSRGELGPEKLRLLEAIGMTWQVRQARWETMYARAAEFHGAHGTLLVSPGEDKELATWLTNLRQARRKNRSTLTQAQIARLDAIGMVWEPYRDSWEEKFALLEEYRQETGHMQPPPGHPLRPWIFEQRTARRQGWLSPERRHRLEALGMCWSVADAHWSRMCAAAAAYYSIHEQLNIPASYVTRDGLRLGSWIVNQRQWRKKLLLPAEPEAAERIRRLNGIGMIWDASKKIYFTSFPEQAVLFYMHRYFPGTQKMNLWEEYGIEIDVYIPELRAGIEYDGIFHQDKQQSDARKDEVCRRHSIRLFRIRVPQLAPIAGREDVFRLADLSAGQLDGAIRAILAALGVPLGRIDVDSTRDGPAILEIYRDLNAAEWDRKYEEAYFCYQKYGSLEARCMPKAPTASLRGWLTKQRRCYYDGLLTGRQIKKLMRLHFLEGALPLCKRRQKSEAPPPGLPAPVRAADGAARKLLCLREEAALARWEQMLALAVQYYSQNGHLLVPDAHGAACAQDLGAWVARQRSHYRRGELTPLQIQRLERAGMVWEPKEQAKRQWLCAAREYFASHGHVNAPLEYRTRKGQRLGAWIANARAKYKRGSLEPEILRALEQMGIAWSPLDAKWERMYGLAAEFYRAHGHLRVPGAHEVPGGGSLAVWIGLQRQKRQGKGYIAGCLTPQQIRRLDEIGMLWDPCEERWMHNYALAKQYAQAHGHLNVPAGYLTPQGKKLGMWIGTQRQAYRGNPNYHMTPRHRALLEVIGMDWRQGQA